MLSKPVKRHLAGVYMITNLVNGKRYIGSSGDIYNRKHTHITKLKKRSHSSKHLTNAYHKYGSENFLFEVLEYCDNSFEQEQYYIDLLKPDYNKDLNVKNTKGRVITQAQRKAISTTLKAKYKAGMKTYKQEHRWIAVEQYTLSGKFVQRYLYPALADKAIGSNQGTIGRACKESCISVHGYQWKYEGSSKEIYDLKGHSPRTKLKVTDLLRGTSYVCFGMLECIHYSGCGETAIYRGLKTGKAIKGQYLFEHPAP